MADPTRIKITALDATRNAFRSVTRGLKGITGAVFSLKTGLISLAGIGGFGLLVKSSLQSIDTLGKTASKLGVTTKELGALRFAAEISGVEIRTVDMATQRFTRRLAEAANGTGEAKDALKELNINASEISKLPLQEQMLRLSDAFADVESSSEKVRLAFKLFDSEGVAFVNILKLGSDELSKLFKEADDLGILLSGSAVEGVEKANDAILKLSKLFKGITDQTLAALAPALEHLATILKDQILDTIKGSNENVSAFGRTLAGEFLQSLKNVIVALQGFLNGMVKVINAIMTFSPFTRDIFKNFDQLKEINIDFTKMDELIRKVGTRTKEIKTDTDNANKSFTTMDQIFKGLKGGLDDYVKGINTLDLSLADITNKGLKSFEDSLLSIFDKTKTVKEAFSDMARSIISDLIRMAIQQQITKPLFGALSGMFGSSTSSAPIPKKAIGGAVQANKPYMVGERGAELFVPSRSGSVVPNNQLSSGGGVTINQTINVTTGVQQTVRTEIANLMPRIAQASKQAVLESRQRGGSFATAFGG
jgi:hypothetical protein